MDEFLKSLASNENIELEHFNELLKSTESQLELIRSLRILIKNKSCYTARNYECYCDIFESICKQISINELEDNKKFIRLFDSISSNQTDQFKISSLISLLKVLTVKNEMDKLSVNQVEVVISSLKVDLSTVIETRSLMKSYENAVQNFIYLFDGNFIEANSISIISFFE